MARRASAIAKLKQQNHGTIIVDAGDALLQRPLAPLTKGDLNKAEAILRAQGLMGTDAMAVGEGEIAVGLNRLRKLARQTSQPLLCANLAQRSGRLAFTPRRLLERGGVKVGLTAVFELRDTEVKAKELVQKAGLRVLDPERAAAKQLKALRAEGAEVTVLLAHTGPERAKELARKLKGLQLVIGGHTGAMYSLPIKEGSTYLVEPGRRGQMLGYVQLRLGEGWQPDAELSDDSPRNVLYTEAREELAKLAKQPKNKPIAKTDPRLLRARSLARRLAGTVDPGGNNRIIARLVTLDTEFPDDPAVKGLLDASRATWNEGKAHARLPAGRGKIRPMHRGKIRTMRRPRIQIEQH